MTDLTKVLNRAEAFVTKDVVTGPDSVPPVHERLGKVLQRAGALLQARRRKDDEEKADKPGDTIPVGTHVTWHYRSAIGHGVITGVAKRGTTSATTKYSIRQSDHHPGEPDIVQHFGSALTRVGKDEKVVRHVRTPAGERRFGQPIGAIIVRDGAAPLKHLISMTSEFRDWQKVKGSNGQSYYIGKHPKKRSAWAAVDKADNVIVEGRTEEDVYEALDAHVGGAKKGKGKRPTVSTTDAAPERTDGRGGKTKGETDSSDFVPYTDKMWADLKKYHPKARVAPSWTDVKINPNYKDPNVGLIATGRALPNAKGKQKLQPVYSEGHKKKAAAGKFKRLMVLAEKMPDLDKALKKDAKKDAVAAAVLVLRQTGARVDSGDTGGKVKAFGVTSLQARHVKFSGSKATLKFIGKEGVENTYVIDDPLTVRVLKQHTQGKKGEDALWPKVTDRKTIDYIREHTGIEAKNHDLRTAIANVEAVRVMSAIEPPTTKREFQSKRKQVGEEVARRLNNTAKQALDNYINPMLFDAWLAGEDW